MAERSVVTAFLNQGNACLGRREYDQACEWFSKVIEQEPSCAEAWSKRGMALAYLGNLVDALRNMNQAATLRPDHWGFHFDRGVVLSNLDKHEDAILAFDAALALDPHNADASANRALSRYTQGEYQRALEDASFALTIVPTHWVALKCKALSLEVLGRLDSSIEAWTQVVAIAPNLAEGYWNRARAKIGTRNLAAAFSDLERALQLDPDCWEAYEVRARANRKVGDITQADLDEATARLLGRGRSVFRPSP
jgi:tetratricopeptide (TPR) repeat protein